MALPLQPCSWCRALSFGFADIYAYLQTPDVSHFSVVAEEAGVAYLGGHVVLTAAHRLRPLAGQLDGETKIWN